jgi:membrane associated rhomboid family serine protease
VDWEGKSTGEEASGRRLDSFSFSVKAAMDGCCFGVCVGGIVSKKRQKERQRRRRRRRKSDGTGDEASDGRLVKSS